MNRVSIGAKEGYSDKYICIDSVVPLRIRYVEDPGYYVLDLLCKYGDNLSIIKVCYYNESEDERKIIDDIKLSNEYSFTTSVAISLLSNYIESYVGDIEFKELVATHTFETIAINDKEKVNAHFICNPDTFACIGLINDAIMNCYTKFNNPDVCSNFIDEVVIKYWKYKDIDRVVRHVTKIESVEIMNGHRKNKSLKAFRLKLLCDDDKVYDIVQLVQVDQHIEKKTYVKEFTLDKNNSYYVMLNYFDHNPIDNDSNYVCMCGTNMKDDKHNALFIFNKLQLNTNILIKLAAIKEN